MTRIVLGDMLHVTLSWPPQALSPNARPHWSSKARSVKSYRLEAFCLARNAGWAEAGQWLKGDVAVPLHLTFVPPHHRVYDEDNLLASIKPALDGLADCLGIDDSRFRLSHQVDRHRIGGLVEIAATL